MSESPSKLQELYHATPRLKSPESVDHHVMRAARAAASDSPAVAAEAKRRAPGIGMSMPALAAMCVIGVGVGLLYQSDKESTGETVIEIVQTPVARSVATEVTPPAAETDLFVEQAPVTATADASALAMEAGTTDSDAAGPQIESFSGLEPLQQQVIVAESLVVPDDDQSDSVVTATAESVTLESKRLSAVDSIESAADTVVRSDISSKALTQPERNEQTLVPGNLWLQKQDGNGFTIRLMTSNTVDKLKAFAASVEQLQTEIVRLNSNQWVLLYGSFDTLTEVQQMFDSLQSGVVASVQNDVAIVAIGELQSLIE